MELGGFWLELFAYDDVEPPSATLGGRRTGFRHLALRTDDLDEAIAGLQAAGLVGPDVAAREVPGLARLLFISDPDDIEIEIMQDLGG